MKLSGGYFIINKTDKNVYEKALSAVTDGKPILWYEDDTTCYYIDTITLSGTTVIMTKGSLTISIANTGTITESGSIFPDVASKSFLYQINLYITNGSPNDALTVYIFTNKDVATTTLTTKESIKALYNTSIIRNITKGSITNNSKVYYASWTRNDPSTGLGAVTCISVDNDYLDFTNYTISYVGKLEL